MGGSFLFVIALAFTTLVLPLWIALHYIARFRSSRGLSNEDAQVMHDLWGTAKKMESRLAALESILDEQHPNWRQRS